MTNNTLVGIYYDANGKVAKIVHADDDDFTPHNNDASLKLVVLSKKEYDETPPPLNINGVPEYHDLNKKTILVADSDLATKIDTKITEVESFLTLKAEEEALLNAEVIPESFEEI